MSSDTQPLNGVQTAQRNEPSSRLPTPREEVTFLLVDDHPVVSFALSHVVESKVGWKVASRATTPAEAMERIAKQLPKVVLLDLVFPGECGLDFLAWLKRNHPKILSIVYSVQPEDIYARRCVRVGARGYISKSASVEVLIETIELVIDGHAVVCGQIVDEEISDFVKSKASSGIDALSVRELEVLHLLGQGMGNKRIAEELCRSAKTIESHRYRIARKLNVPNGPELILYAMQHRVATALIPNGESRPAATDEQRSTASE